MGTHLILLNYLFRIQWVDCVRETLFYRATLISVYRRNEIQNPDATPASSINVQSYFIGIVHLVSHNMKL